MASSLTLRVEGFADNGIDQLVAAARSLVEEQRKQTPDDVKFAESVAFNGVDPNNARQQTTEGMRQVLETFRSG